MTTKTQTTNALLLDVLDTVATILVDVALLRERCHALDDHLRQCEPPIATAPENFVITREWLHQHATERDGFTRRQLAVLGIAWPPKKGWLSALDGTVITREQQAAFERKGRSG